MTTQAERDAWEQRARDKACRRSVLDGLPMPGRIEIATTNDGSKIEHTEASRAIAQTMRRDGPMLGAGEYQAQRPENGAHGLCGPKGERFRALIISPGEAVLMERRRWHEEWMRSGAMTANHIRALLCA